MTTPERFREKLDHLSQYEGQVLDNIDDSKSEYVDDYWEDEFDDIHEAYEEQGRGQAEFDCVKQLILDHYPKTGRDELLQLMDALADDWGLSYD